MEKGANKKVKLAIVGCGGIARAHLEAYTKIKEKEPDKFEIVSLCDTDKDSLERFAQESTRLFGKRPDTFLNLSEMLKSTKPNAVDICTPHSEHHKVAIQCIKAGANVMVEKPFGITIRASKAIIAAGKRYKKIVATAENVRRGINQRTMYWLVNEAKLLGIPRMFYAVQAGWEDPLKTRNWHWRIDQMLSGGGMVMDSGAHFCDSIRYFFGDVHMVYAFVGQFEKWPHNKERRVIMDEREDSWIATLTFKSGLVGLWSWTMAAPGHSFAKVVYYGSNGALIDSGDVFHGPFDGSLLTLKDGTKYSMSELRDKFLNSISEERKNRLFPHGFTEGLVIECYDFLDAIQNQRMPEVDGEEGLKAKAIAEAIYESARLGIAVKYEDVLRGKISTYQNPIDKYHKLIKAK
ncbi:MAG: Gfo/Idh/MocA family oxidoreductase [Candidatus Bathyarchaeia archaeon]